MQETPHSGPTRASAAAVPPLGLRCVGAMATRHSSSRLHSGHDQDGDVLNGRQPRRGHEPVLRILGTSSRTSPDVPAQARAFRSPSRGLEVYSGQCAPSGARRDDATGLLSDGLHASRRALTDSHTRDSRDEGAEYLLPADAPPPSDRGGGAPSLSERGSILVLGALVACGIATAFGVMPWGAL